MSSPIAPAPPVSAAKVPGDAEFTFPSGRKRVLQVNFCKNCQCENYGIPATLSKYARRAKSKGVAGAEYTISGGGTSAAPQPNLVCSLCGEFLPIKSNSGICEELARITQYLVAPAQAGCPNEDCKNFGSPAPDSSRYKSYGLTRGGSQRYRCRGCEKTFSISHRATLRQREARKNVPILRGLMNKAVLSRLAEVQDVSIQTIYDKIEFFERQALAFARKQESRLPEVVKGTKRYLCIDRQDYFVNWTKRADKRNVVLRAIGSADMDTGYVFGMHINFDGAASEADVEAEAVAAGDYKVPVPFRRHARLWLAGDYGRSVAEAATRLAKRRRPDGTLPGDIQRSYDEAASRQDVESPEAIKDVEKFPSKGMQVHLEYSMYAHFYVLHEMLGTAAKLRFFMDQESGIRAACLAAFETEIRERRADAFFVRLAKEMTVGQKRKLVAASREEFEAVKAANPTLADYDIQVLMMKERIVAARAYGKWLDRWAEHPLPNHAEPKKSLCHLTDYGDLDSDHQARLYLKGSLHAIDRFFESTRRRLNMLERPIGTSSKAGRNWYGYSAYQPANIEKLLNIFRLYYNFCLAGKDKKTPAMRLGLMDRRITPAELLGM